MLISNAVFTYQAPYHNYIIINTLRPRQSDCHFPDDIFKWIFLNENVWISINISLKFVPRGPINNIPTLVQVMAWRRPVVIISHFLKFSTKSPTVPPLSKWIVQRREQLVYWWQWCQQCLHVFWKIQPGTIPWEYISLFTKPHTVKPVYNDHLMEYFSVFWSSSRWPRATQMSSRRQKLLPRVNWYFHSSLKHITE